jgi:hypothetical protein
MIRKSCVETDSTRCLFGATKNVTRSGLLTKSPIMNSSITRRLFPLIIALILSLAAAPIAATNAAPERRSDASPARSLLVGLEPGAISDRREVLPSSAPNQPREEHHV